VLSGFAKAIRAGYPQVSAHLGIVRLVGAVLPYVTTEDSIQLGAHLKEIYQRAAIVEAEDALKEFPQARDTKYSTIAKMWRTTCAEIFWVFDFPPRSARPFTLPVPLSGSTA
jgi:transposase-like protein